MPRQKCHRQGLFSFSFLYWHRFEALQFYRPASALYLLFALVCTLTHHPKNTCSSLFGVKSLRPPLIILAFCKHKDLCTKFVLNWMLQSLYSILTNLFVVQVQVGQVIVVTVVSKSRSFILRKIR